MKKMNFKRLETYIEEALKGKKHKDVEIFLKTETFVDVVESHHVSVTTEEDKTILTYEDGSFITLMDAYDFGEDAIVIVVHCGNYNRYPFKNPAEKEKIIL